MGRIIGIDLGTTNCVLSYAALGAEAVVPRLLSLPTPTTVKSW